MSDPLPNTPLAVTADTNVTCSSTVRKCSHGQVTGSHENMLTELSPYNSHLSQPHNSSSRQTYHNIYQNKNVSNKTISNAIYVYVQYQLIVK
jgi:hypothetical protein